MATNYIRQRLSIQNERKEKENLDPGQSPGGPPKAEAKERILFQSQLLFVSYLAGKNRRRTKQEHKYRKIMLSR